VTCNSKLGGAFAGIFRRPWFKARLIHLCTNIISPRGAGI